jgi:hypothetical protein
MHFISGLSHRCGDKWIHNQQRAPRRLEDDEIRLPDRSARVLKCYTILGRQADVVETSRGCTMTVASAPSSKCAVVIFTLILLTAFRDAKCMVPERSSS